jgi:hypothetical protein
MTGLELELPGTLPTLLGIRRNWMPSRFRGGQAPGLANLVSPINLIPHRIGTTPSVRFSAPVIQEPNLPSESYHPHLPPTYLPRHPKPRLT